MQPTTEIIATDFFGRKIVKATPVMTDNEAENHVPVDEPVQKFRAVYKFNEGSSSAVRKTIKMSALM